MVNLKWWRTSASMGTLRRDIDEILAEFGPPGGFRRELDRLLEAGLSSRVLRREMNRLFDEFVSPPPLRRRLARRLLATGTTRSAWRWRLDRLVGKVMDATGLSRLGRRPFVPLVTERRDDFVVRLDLAGIHEKDIDIRLDGNELVISGKRRHEEIIELPRGVDAGNIEATHLDGVLEVRIPKRTPAWMRRVAVRSQNERDLDGRGRNGGGFAGRRGRDGAPPGYASP